MGCDPASRAASSRGIVYYAAGQIHFPANMGENLLQGSFDLLTCPGSFRRHQFDSSFLIAATSRDLALRPEGFPL